MDTKQCAECKVTKPRAEFWANKSKKDGLRSNCKVCAGLVNACRYPQVVWQTPAETLAIGHVLNAWRYTVDPAALVARIAA